VVTGHDLKEQEMYTSPETVFAIAKQRQLELIADAERSRLLSAARRRRRSRSQGARSEHAL
jgi:hypothetical protein